jgi:2-polyprenyl-3-methyl-5-hydroxy-6-metoxy-1,4-benzoquinol methylase
MTSRQLLFRTFYQLGFTPWDGHPIATSLRSLVEGSDDEPPLTPGRALDVGCGTGDTSIYLAQHGWQVTGVDFVSKAVHKARAKAEAAGVDIDIRQGDATKLSTEGISNGFGLIVDQGCLHAISGDDRDKYVREVTAVAAPDARLMLVEFTPGGTIGVPGIDQAEIERRFTEAWTLVSTGDQPYPASRRANTLKYYILQRNR